MAGGGDTQDTRFDNALKYRLAYGPVHFGALYKFPDGQGGCYSASATWTAATCTPEAPHNSAYGFDLSGAYGGFSADVVFQHVNQAISVLNPLLGPSSLSAPYQSTLNSINTNPINGANLIGTTDTEYGIVTDNTAVMVGAKYAWDRFKFFGGCEHIRMLNPANPLGVGATAQGGYLLSGVEDNNLDSPKIVQVFWTGVKYAFDGKTDVTLSYYQRGSERLPRSVDLLGCGRASRSSLRGHAWTRPPSMRTITSPGVSTSIPAPSVSPTSAAAPAIAIPHGPGVPYFFNDNVALTVGGRFAF